jgi:glycosyltransferase involved in cell wall biosynthesis
VPTSSRQLRIALLITELDVGGAEKCLVRLACGLDRNRFTPEVTALAEPPRENRGLVAQLKAASIPVRFLNVRQVWQFPGAVAQLKREFLRRPPDVVQSFLFHANVAAAWALPDRLPHALGVRVADPRRWRLWLEKRAARSSRKIVCVSQTVADDWLRRSGSSSEKIAVIPNGIEVDPFQIAQPCNLEPAGIAADRKILLFLGRLDRQKGVDWLLRLAPSLLDQLPDHDLVLAGHGPWQSRVRRATLDHPRLAGRLHLIGWQDNTPGLLKRSSLLLLPSRWEGMPNVVLEAMAAGIPVAATRVEGVAELLGDATDAQTFAFGDSAQALAKIRALATDPPLRSSLSTANLQRATAEFGVARMLQRYAALYDELSSS